MASKWELREALDSWYGRLADLIEDIQDAGYDVEEANEEYITASYEDGDATVYLDLRLGGTARTITVDSIREIERI